MLRGGYGLYHFPIPARTFNGMRGNPPLQGSYSFNWNDSANAPDGLPNYFLRAAPTVIAGVNTANLPELSIAKPPVILPGVAMIALGKDLPTSAAHQWNLTLEAEIMKDTVVARRLRRHRRAQQRERAALQRQPDQQLRLVQELGPAAADRVLPQHGAARHRSDHVRRHLDLHQARLLELHRRSAGTGAALQPRTGVPVLLSDEQLGVYRQRGVAGRRLRHLSERSARDLPARRGAAGHRRSPALLPLPARSRIFRSTASAGTTSTICRSAAARSSPATSARSSIAWSADGRSPATARPRAATGRCPPPTGARSARSRSTEPSTRSPIAARGPASPVTSTTTATFRRIGSIRPPA